MLRADLIRPRLHLVGDQVKPRLLPLDYHWLDVAREIKKVFAVHIGRSRGELEAALRDFEGDSLEYPILRGLSAVLEARCTFDNEPPVQPERLRLALFGQGPVGNEQGAVQGRLEALWGDGVVKSRGQLMRETAESYQLTSDQVESALFADLAEEQILRHLGEEITPGELISRYNVEIARGLLYWAREVRLQVWDSYKEIFKYIKLFKLMYQVRPLPENGYEITLFGPISPFVKSTTRYGLQFARFLPALLLCQKWQMSAEVRPPQADRFLRYVLSDQSELQSHFQPVSTFDSRLEADFAAEFMEKYGRTPRTWVLSREDEIIVVGDSVMIPDFAFTHKKNGRRALLEIIGYWHPDYVRRKVAKVKEANRRDLILLVYESANVAEGTFEAVSSGEVIVCKNKPVLQEVITAVEQCAM